MNKTWFIVSDTFYVLAFMKRPIFLKNIPTIILFLIININFASYGVNVTYSLPEIFSFLEASIPSAQEKKEEGREMMKERMEQLIKHLSMLSILDSKNVVDCVNLFASKLLKEEIKNDNIIPLLGGTSGDLVFLVKSKSKELVIKTFRQDENDSHHHHFFRETLATNKIANLGLKKIKTVQIIDVAACELENSIYVMNGQTYILGVTTEFGL